MKDLVDAIAATTGIETEQLRSFEVGCREGLRRSGVLGGRVFPMSSSEVWPMIVEMCAETARSAGTLEVAAEAMGTESDPEEVARGFVTLLAEQRGIEPPEGAVQACTRGFLRVFASSSS